MTLSAHLFVSDTDGHLYDTRVADWSHHPLRMNYSLHHREIATTADLRATLRAGSHAWPGGYPLFFVTADGEAVSYAGARKYLRDMLENIQYRRSERIAAVSVNYEDGTLRCSLTDERIPSAYAEPDDGPDLTKAVLFADANRGVYIPQHFAEAIDRSRVTGVSDEDYATLALGPDAELYWDTWERVENNAEINHPELGACTLHQDGDLWIIPK